MKKTVPYIRNLKNNRVVSMMTAYDYPSAKAVSEAEIDIILVGDSLLVQKNFMQMVKV